MLALDVLTHAEARYAVEPLSQEPDRETMRKACEEMDRLREETRRRVGTVDVAVEFVRDASDQ